MAKLKFKTLSFSTQENQLKVTLLKQFYCSIPQEEVEKIAKFKLLDANTIEFKNNQ